MARLSLFPAAAWLRQTTPASLRADVLAGLTNAAIVLPQGVAFATIAGLPPEMGLYTAMVTAVVAALFGSSMVMVSGPTTALSALLFATLQGIAVPGTARYVELALLLTLMVGQGLSNTLGSFFSCYVGSGSFTRSGVNAEAGARTPLSAIAASLFLAAILLAFGQWITAIPQPAMAGLIVYVAWRLIDRREIRHIVQTSRPETLILLLTLGAGLLIELDFAIYVGVIASFSVFIYDSAHPSLRVSAPVQAASGRRKFRNADLHAVPECPQLVSVRLDGPLYFGSVEHVEAEWKALRAKRPGQVHVIFYLKGVGKIDLSGADFLIQAIREIRAAGGSFCIVALFPPLLECLRHFHVLDELDEGALHISKGEAVAAAVQRLDHTICGSCTRRVFTECAGLPGAAPAPHGPGTAPPA